MTERRCEVRASGARVHAIAGRVRAGHDVTIVDLSASGALVEGGRPLRPGSLIDVQLAREGERLIVSARVVRCLVAAIDANDGIRYHAGLAFEHPLAWMCEGTPASVSMPRGIAPARASGACSRYPEGVD